MEKTLLQNSLVTKSEKNFVLNSILTQLKNREKRPSIKKIMEVMKTIFIEKFPKKNVE